MRARCRAHLAVACAALLAATACLVDCSAGGPTPSDRDAAPADLCQPPARQLVDKRLFGEMPIENYFLDPQFALISLGWLAFTDRGTGRILRLDVAHTPLGQPVLQIPKSQNSAGLVVAGQAAAPAGPVALALYAARQQGAEDPELQQTRVSLVGMMPSGAEAAIELGLDTELEPVLQEGLVWRRFVAFAPAPPVGQVFLMVQDQAASDLFLSSPLLIDGDSAAIRTFVLRHAPTPPPRAVNAAEGRALRQFKRHLHQLDRGLRPRLRRHPVLRPQRRPFDLPGAAGSRRRATPTGGVRATPLVLYFGTVTNS